MFAPSLSRRLGPAGLWALLLASPSGPASASESGPYGLFWSGGRTWLVDAGRAQLFSAPGFVTVDPDGALRRFRQRVEAHRPGARDAGLPAPASRRAVWETVATPSRAWQGVLAPLEPWPPAGESLVDERALVQFTGEVLTTVRFQRLSGRDGAVRTVIEGGGWETSAGRSRAAPTGAGEALAWVAAHVPFALDPCLTRPAGLLPLEGAGGRETPYLLAAGAAPECADRVRALALAGAGEATHWPPGVIDRRPLPDGGGALVLLGEPVDERRPAVDDLLALADPCALQTLRLDRAGGSAESSVELGGVPALDGFRWLPTNGPWTPWLGLLFAPAERCGAAVRLLDGGPAVRVDGDVAEWPVDALDPVAALCRIVEVGRAWSGGTDLSAEAAARAEPGGALVVAVVVRDVESSPHDLVHVLSATGDVTVTRDGRVESSGLGTVRAAASQRASGYTVEIRLPAGALGSPPALAVAIDDADPGDPEGAGLRLWVAGEPIGDRAAQPLPLEAPR